MVGSVLIGAIIFALFLYYRKEIFLTKLMRGGYSLGLMFWLYGVFFTILLAGSLLFYVNYKFGLVKTAQNPNILDVSSAFSSISVAFVILAIHFYMVAIGIWKSADNYKGFFLFRIWARNFIFTIPLAALLVLRSPLAFIIGFILYLLLNKYKKKY